MRHAIAVTLLLASTAFGADRDPANYDRVLLPFTGVSSGFGGAWTAQWWFHNDGDTAVDVFPLASACGLCPPAFHYTITGSIQPHGTPTFFFGDVLPGPLSPVATPVSPSPPGALLYVERGKTGQLNITGFLGRLTVSGIERRSVSSGLRAIPESRFRPAKQSILVRSLPNNRFTLRVYALPETVDDPALTIRWFLISEGTGIGPPPINGESLFGTTSTKLATPESDAFRSECGGTCGNIPR